VISDHAPAHHGNSLRDYLTTPDLCLRLVSLPGYSPDFNADEAIWDWAREEVTANLCLGTKAAVQEKLGNFFATLAYPTDEVKQRCRTALPARAEELLRGAQASHCPAIQVDPILALATMNHGSPPQMKMEPGRGTLCLVAARRRSIKLGAMSPRFSVTREPVPAPPSVAPRWRKHA
jgi:hypothetical protein